MSAIERLSSALHGVGATVATPFADDLLSVDTAALRDNVTFMVSGGVTLLYPAGNTGEFASLSLEDWTAVVETVVAAAAAAGEDSVVVPGIGQNLPTALEMRRRADALGAGGVLIMPPEQPHISDEGLHRYFETLLEAGAAPAVVYRRAHGPSDAVAGTLAHHPLVAGVKYGLKEVHTFREAVRAHGDHAVWTCGIAERYAPAFAAHGSAGYTSGLVNFAPRLTVALADALRQQDYPAALELRDQMAGFEDLRARDAEANNVSAIKSAMDHHGLAGGRVRPPQRDLDERTSAEVREMTAGWK